MDKLLVTQDILDSINIISVSTYIDGEDLSVLVLECETKTQADNLFLLPNSNFFLFNYGTDASEIVFLDLCFPDAKLKKRILLPDREIIDLFRSDRIRYLTTGFMNESSELDFSEITMILERANYSDLN